MKIEDFPLALLLLTSFPVLVAQTSGEDYIHLRPPEKNNRTIGFVITPTKDTYRLTVGYQWPSQFAPQRYWHNTYSSISEERLIVTVKKFMDAFDSTNPTVLTNLFALEKKKVSNGR